MRKDVTACGNYLIGDNTISGVVSKAMADFHDIIVSVFGPYGNNAWITKDGNPYFTRDGKEVFTSLRTDNDLINYIQKILYQAVENQARIVGDGTTTLLAYYTNLYNTMHEYLKSSKMKDSRGNVLVGTRVFKETYNEIIVEIISKLKEQAEPLQKEDLKSLFYTCTQDKHLTAELYTKIADAIMDDAEIIVNKSNLPNTLTISESQYPTIKANCTYCSGEYSESGTIQNATVFFTNGALNIENIDTLTFMASVNLDQKIFPNIVFLAASVTDNTRRTLRKFDEWKKRVKAQNGHVNDIYVFTIQNFSSYTAEQIDDLVAYIYNMPGISGMQDFSLFEAYLYQAFASLDAGTDSGYKNDTLGKIKLDVKLIEMVKRTFCSIQELEYAYGIGIKFSKDMPPRALERYQKLLDDMKDEKSEIKRYEYVDRLKKLYGKYIVVDVGSKLLKDGQNTFELVLDAVISAKNARQYGIIRENSIYQTAVIVSKMKDTLHQDIKNLDMSSTNNEDAVSKNLKYNIVCNIIDTLALTIADMILNKFPSDDKSNLLYYIHAMIRIASSLGDNGDISLISIYDEKFANQDLTGRFERNEICSNFDINRPIHEMFNFLPTPYKFSVDIDSADGDNETETFSAEVTVIEPVMSISNILDMSDIIIDIACGEVFVMNRPYFTI